MKATKPANILIVDDDRGHLISLRTVIRSWGYRVATAEDGLEAVAAVKESQVELILMDVRMTTMSGIEALERIKIYNPSIPIIIMTAYSSVASAVEALKGGAYDYLIKPFDFDVLKLSIERACEHAGLKVENEDLRARLQEDFDRPDIIGKSASMKALMDMLAMVAPSEATVMITGESGTGKELIAKSLHYNSARKAHPLVTVNCAALTESLLESELFGHEKGAFTGADRRREGRFMLADGGTIFLDEVGETSSRMQAKLLRVLQEKEIQRVGSEAVLQVDVRVVAATNRDLEEDVQAGRFREDLFYRLNVMHLTIPPLRDRQEDIPLLAQHFLETYARRNRKTVKGFAPLAMSMLLKYEWPGNVRELENAIERAVILLSGEHITEKQLPLRIVRQHPDHATAADTGMPATDGTRTLEDIEKEAIEATLAATDGNKSETARRLGISRKTLHNKLKAYGVG
ncbi:MAG: sigma-54 dependent transcriptional regulator [Deltaproteobacteria bacterium]|jgi:two-component system response regulator HydG|nr:sigma-54 dependent transcriptional regulator [Deltaproteobacteria bacterium]